MITKEEIYADKLMRRTGMTLMSLDSAYRATNMGPRDFQRQHCQCDTSVGFQCPYCVERFGLEAAERDVCAMASALRAIIARIDGEFDNIDLLEQGPLATDRIEDIRRIAKTGLTNYCWHRTDKTTPRELVRRITEGRADAT